MQTAAWRARAYHRLDRRRPTQGQQNSSLFIPHSLTVSADGRLSHLNDEAEQYLVAVLRRYVSGSCGAIGILRACFGVGFRVSGALFRVRLMGVCGAGGSGVLDRSLVWNMS